MLETLDIPDDLETCQRLLRELAEAHARLQRVYEELLDTCASVQDSQQKLQQERDELQLTIQRLLHQWYGRRSERRKEAPGQQHLDFGDTDTTVVDLSIVSAAGDEGAVSEYVVRRRQAPREVTLIPGGRFGFGVATEVLFSKFVLHVPLYRGRDAAPYNVFAFTDNRARAGPDEFLEPFAGTITGDCYSGYVNIEKVTHGRIRFSACLAHARRKIFEARQQQPALSSEVLALMGELYDVEDRARTLDDAARLALRQEKSVPVMERLKKVLDSEAAKKVLPRSRFGEALDYLRNHEEAFQLYLEDGRLPISPRSPRAAPLQRAEDRALPLGPTRRQVLRERNVCRPDHVSIVRLSSRPASFMPCHPPTAPTAVQFLVARYNLPPRT